MDAKTKKLRTLCKKYGLSAAVICEMTGRGKSIVQHWMSGKHKQIPDHMLELVELKISKRTNAAKEV